MILALGCSATCLQIVPVLGWTLSTLGPVEMTVVGLVSPKVQNYICMEVRS